MNGRWIIPIEMATVLACANLLHSPAHAAAFLVQSGQTVELGVSGVETNYVFDTFTIQAGGKVLLDGDVTVTVNGDAEIDGEVDALPNAKQADGAAGADGPNGLNNQATGLNGGPIVKGGNGGDAGNALVASYGGRAGAGGPGGALYLSAQELTNIATLKLNGGGGGAGGQGQDTGIAMGGSGGAPNGKRGLDSGPIPRGMDGANGAYGLVYYRNPWASIAGSRFSPGNPWWQSTGGGGINSTLVNGMSGLVLSATDQPVSLSAPVDTASPSPLVLTIQLNWLTTTGSLDISLASSNLVHVAALGTLSPTSAQVQEVISDPSLLNQGFQPLVVQLNPGSPSQVQILQLSLEAAPERLQISVPSAGSSQVNLSWYGTSNTTYQVQFLAPGTNIWTNVGHPIMGQGQNLEFSGTLDRSLSWKFYRLSLLQPVP
jgi:hypothetical protein